MAPSSGDQSSPAAGRTGSGPEDITGYLGGAAGGVVRKRDARPGAVSAGLLALQPLADALPQPADRALGLAEPFADLLGRVPLQAQLQDRALVLVQAGEQPVHRLAQHGRFERRRLTAEGFRHDRAGRRGHFPADVTALGTVIGDPVVALAHGDHGEQAPQAVPAADLQVPLAVAAEEALVRRLHDLLGIDLVPQGGAELALGQRDQLAGEAPEDFAAGGLVPVPQAGEPLRERILASGHDRLAPGADPRFLADPRDDPD